MFPDISSFLPLIYSSIPEPALWKNYLEHFAQCFRVGITNLSILYPKNPEVAVLVAAGPGATDENLREWREKWAHLDPWVSGRDMTAYGEGLVIRSETLISDEELEKTEIYRSFLGRNGMHYGGGVMLSMGPGQMAVQTFTRPKSEGPLTDQELALWQALAPHAVRAVKLQGQLQQAEAGQRIFRASFENDAAGMLLVNQARVVIESNSEGRRVLSQCDGLALDNLMRLTATESEVSKTLARQIHEVGYPGPLDRPRPRQLIVPRSGIRRPLLLDIAPLLGEGDRTTNPQLPTVCVRVIDPEAGRVPDAALLQSLFGLTEAEAQFCCRLAGGLTVEEIAKVSFVSPHTTRTHLKRALSKTGTVRQAELMVLLHRVAVQGA